MHIALVWTKYQFLILLSLLYILNIKKSSVILIIHEKAMKQGVHDSDFYLSINYKKEISENISKWPDIKKNIDELLGKINIQPDKIFLRNFDSAIGRRLISTFNGAHIYLFEEGISSYIHRNKLGLSGTWKDKLRTILLRLYFTKSANKFSALPKVRTSKAGIFKNVEPWLAVPFIPLKLEPILSNGYYKNRTKEKFNYKVLIIDQPLAQAGINKENVILSYKYLFEYIIKNICSENKYIAIKQHPSTLKKELESILSSVGVNHNIKIINSDSNIEELIYNNMFPSLEIIAGFYSATLYVVKSILKPDSVKIISFKTDEIFTFCKDKYEALDSIGIEIVDPHIQTHRSHKLIK